MIDIETANDLKDALAYDVGFVVADKKGNIYEKYSLMIADIFIHDKELLNTAYYAEKILKYWKDYKQGTRKLCTFKTAKDLIHKAIAKYNIKDVYAYNCGFDLNGLNTTQRYYTKSQYRYFFPYGMNYHCIWHMACQVIATQKSYLKVALEQEWYSPSGNVRTDAEHIYQYLYDEFFEESHTGLEDVIIETKILAKCYAQHKPMQTNINRGCWRIPQKDFKKLLTNE